MDVAKQSKAFCQRIHRKMEQVKEKFERTIPTIAPPPLFIQIRVFVPLASLTIEASLTPVLFAQIMGKNKKKGSGAAKTALKTEKKDAKKFKKELKAKGEEDIESLIAKFSAEDKKNSTVSEEVTDPPTRRLHFTFQFHPEKDELLLFGGEFYNGIKTFMYNELYSYNIKKNEWTLIKTPVSPPPRSAHQAVCVPQAGGQLWIFGGEFASPTQSQFYHYKDLWVYHIQNKKWEKVNASHGPSARSGHRMCLIKRNIFVFGGFHDNLRECKYYNDVYIFNLDTYTWTKLDPIGNGPSPRSACQLACTSDGKLIVFGGYSKIQHKKDYLGVTHFDMFSLHQDNHDQNKWKWVQVKQSGMKPPARTAFSLTMISNNKAILFGGVQDEQNCDNDEELNGKFFNDLYQLEIDKGHWSMITLKNREKAIDQKKSRRKKKVSQDVTNEVSKMDVDSESSESEDESPKIQDMTINPSTVDEDDIFKVTIGPQSQADSDPGEPSAMSCITHKNMPHPRRNAACTVKHGTLYLYGGSFEVGDKQVTLNDFHSIDVRKFTEWKTIIKADFDQEWLDSGSEDEDEDESDDESGSSDEDT